jgi:Family of unknown function (DUF6232)
MRSVLVDVAQDEAARRVAIIAEEPIYEWEGVLVSTSRLAVRGRSYPIGGIGDVRVIEPKFRSVLTALCAGLSGVLAISALVLPSVQAAVIAIAFLVSALGFRTAATRHLNIDVGGERVTICASDPALIAEIVDAISVAKRSVHIVQRAPAVERDGALARVARSGAA